MGPSMAFCSADAARSVSLKGITETQAARHSAHDHPLSRAEPSGPQFLYGDCTVRLPRTIRNTAKSLLQKSKDLQSLSLPGDPARGQGYEKRQWFMLAALCVS